MKTVHTPFYGKFTNSVHLLTFDRFDLIEIRKPSFVILVHLKWLPSNP